MPVPTYNQLITLSQGGPGYAAESVQERILTILAMLASGTAPDGTTLGGGGPRVYSVDPSPIPGVVSRAIIHGTGLSAVVNVMVATTDLSSSTTVTVGTRTDNYITFSHNLAWQSWALTDGNLFLTDASFTQLVPLYPLVLS